MSEDGPPPPDQVPGAPHPRDTLRLFGQEAAEAQFLDAYARNRLHHGWLLTGPRGVGKATLAWRIARFLLATPLADAQDGLFGAPPPPETLDVPPDHPVSRRIAARSEPGLAAITRSVNEDTGRMRGEIVVDDIRRLHRFFTLSAADGGRRVVIVDCSDDLNTNAANALLKMLEEPPARAFLLLVAHQTSRLLPTIRSRCRTLRLAPLRPDAMAQALEQAGAHSDAKPEHLAALAGGSVGAALRLLAHDGLDLYADLLGVLGTLPRLDRARAQALADTVSARGAAARFDLFLDLADALLARLAVTGATGAAPSPPAAANEGEILLRQAASAEKGRAWAGVASLIGARTRQGVAVNLDPAALVLDTVLKMQETAAG